jgi:hypothetical protein
LAGSAPCVLRDGRFRGLLRMRNFLNPSKSYPHPEERPKSLPQAGTGGASRRTQGRYAALRLSSCPASQRIPPWPDPAPNIVGDRFRKRLAVNGNRRNALRFSALRR